MKFKNLNEENNTTILLKYIRNIEKCANEIKKNLSNDSNQETVLENAYFVAKYGLELFGNCNIDEIPGSYIQSSTYKYMIKDLKKIFEDNV